MRAVVFIGLLSFGGSSCAAGWTWDAVIPSGANTIEYTAGGMTVSNGPGTGSMFIGRDFGAPSAGATRAQAALVNETLRLPSVGGAGALDVVATRGLSMLALGNAVVAVGGAAYVGWEIGSAIAVALGLGATGPGDDRIVPGSSGWMRDPGQSPTAETRTLYGANGYQPKATAEEFCRSKMDIDYPFLTPSGYAPRYDSTNSAGSVLYVYAKGTSIYGNGSCVANPQTALDPNVCPAVIDALNPRFSQPKGVPRVSSDGKCPSGRYTTATPADVVNSIGNKAPLGVAAGLAADILLKGGTIKDAQPGTISGPASKPLSPTTEHTVNPDGTTRDTTTTRTVNYTYGPQTINYSTTNIVTTNNAGNVTTTTTTTAAPPAPEDDTCKANPTTLGCSQFGTPPTDSPVPSQKPLQYSPDDLGFGGSCPAPWVGDVHYLGKTAHLTMSYQPVCDVSPIVRVGLLALAAMAGATILVMGVSKT